MKFLRTAIRRILKLAAIFLLLYFFLVSIGLMSTAFKGFGEGFAENLIRTTSNPVVGLFIGLFATSIIQSSSTTTSIVVGFVASGVLSVRCAIPIVMGANMGTTVTNTIVALGHITRRDEFRRAFSGSTMHDMFNILTVLILFPLELSCHYLERTATFLARGFADVGGLEVINPVKAAIKPAIHTVETLLGFALNREDQIFFIIMLALALTLLFFSLFLLVRVMKSIIAKRSEIIFDKIVGKSIFLSLLMGCFFTAIVQSSSVTTSILVPLIGAGILTQTNAFPITVGANIGTTVTAFLAALAGNQAAITIAIAHFIFNITGTCIFLPWPAMRKIPIGISKFLGERCSKHRVYALIYVVTVFFILPGLLILLSKLLQKGGCNV